MKIDLHVHSVYSGDSVLKPEQIARLAKEKGLDAVAVTDHNTIKGAIETKKYEKSGFKVVVGSEIVTDRGEVTGLFLKREIRQGSFHQVVRAVKRQGGMVVLPHPFDCFRKGVNPTNKDIKFIDAIEGFNAKTVLNRYNEKAVSFGNKHRLPVVAGSDAHYGFELGCAGIATANNNIKKCILGKKFQRFGKKVSTSRHLISRLINQKL